MQRAAGLHDDTAQAKYEKLDALLVQSSTPRQDAALLAEMLSLPNDGRYPTLQLYSPTAAATKDTGSPYCANGDAFTVQAGADDFR